MSIVLLGLNQNSAAVEVRERLAFDAAQAAEALRWLKQLDGGAEFVLLSTCNRVELYYAGEQDLEQIAPRLVAFLSGFHGIGAESFKSCLYFRENEEAVRHLLRVASGLDSLVVGESQILGQVKASYSHACAAKSTGKILNRLFHCAFFTAKSVQTRTAVSSGRVSVAGVAVELALQLFAQIERAKVVVIGAGETGELVVQHLLKAGCRDITVVNRTYERAAELARRCRIGVGSWEELGSQIGRANIVISSAAVQEVLYTRESFERTVPRPRSGALLIIDVGVPRNFDPAINKISDVYLYGMDELKEVAEQNLKAREQDVSSGLEIVSEQVTEFMDWLHAKDLGPMIGRMKEEFHQIGRKELERFLVGPRQDACCRAMLEQMVDRVINKLLHCMIKNVDAVAKEAGAAEAARLIERILGQAREISSTADPEEDRQP